MAEPEIKNRAYRMRVPDGNWATLRVSGLRAQVRDALRAPEGPDFGKLSHSERDALLRKMFGV